ncbi:MAG: DUF1819 family protein [Rhodocyclaceae bacterium]|nr:DUF1819 family protein [Rhodocyclaceae bacterium]
MSTPAHYTTQLQAGLGLMDETKVLLDIWQPGQTASQLYQAALDSGRFPNVTARRLRNVVAECFAPRYLTNQGIAAQHLKTLATRLNSGDLLQIFLLFTARANPILADFIREVYWDRYASGHTQVSNEDAKAFVQRGIDDGKTSKRWSETTVRRVSAYLTGCCADYGLLEKGTRSTRRMLTFRLTQNVAAYLAYDLHFSGLSDPAVINHEDWRLFGLSREEVIEELRRLSLKGFLIFQAGGDVTRISWKHPTMEVVCDVLA